MKIRNVSDGDRTIAATNETVPPDGTAEVPAVLGKSLCDQPDVWKPVQTKSKKEG